MNVWIFVISALFTPVVEPFGLVDRAEETPVVVPAVETPVQTLETAPELRYHGIERMLAQLDAHAQ
jgi:hypothetical protein